MKPCEMPKRRNRNQHSKGEIQYWYVPLAAVLYNKLCRFGGGNIKYAI